MQKTLDTVRANMIAPSQARYAILTLPCARAVLLKPQRLHSDRLSLFQPLTGKGRVSQKQTGVLFVTVPPAKNGSEAVIVPTWGKVKSAVKRGKKPQKVLSKKRTAHTQRSGSGRGEARGLMSPSE